MRLDRGLFDAMPVSLITTSTVSALCALAQVPRNELRFRPNFVIAPTSGAPYAEDEWVGRSLRIGDTSPRIHRRARLWASLSGAPRGGRPRASSPTHNGRPRPACARV